MERVNMHTHTSYCGHGEGSVEALVAAAKQKGIVRLAVTEHFPLSTALDYDAYLSMRAEDLDSYEADVLQARSKNPDMHILLGCEMDWLGAEEDRAPEQKDLSRFDLVLGSVHFVDGWAFDDPSQKGRWDELGADYIWRRYFELWCKAVLSDEPFTIMSHPDLCKKFGYRPSFDPTELYREAAEAARVAGRMVEVNTSGAFYACKEMYPAPGLLQEFRHAEVPCSIGTDAHTPANVARGLDDGIKLMYESGYREITVPTTSKDRCSITID
ncbi:MAG: histidinol-phosphatase HisJ family protein [Raoultibacter sp.]|jgi:histidinol-phosphatase (PHP family)